MQIGVELANRSEYESNYQKCMRFSGMGFKGSKVQILSSRPAKRIRKGPVRGNSLTGSFCGKRSFSPIILWRRWCACGGVHLSPSLNTRVTASKGRVEASKRCLSGQERRSPGRHRVGGGSALLATYQLHRHLWQGV